jgi:hypothetical protein
VLVAMVLIAIALVPATDALQVAMLGSGQHETTAVQHYRAYGRLEELMTEGFATTAPSSYSDALGTPNRRLVFLSPYDADNADADNDRFTTGVDPGIVWLRVEIEDSPIGFESLKTL